MNDDQNEAIDCAFLAEQLVMPSFDEVATNINEVDPGVLLAAIAKFKLFLAEGLEGEFAECYHYCFAQQVAQDYQQLKNLYFRFPIA